MANILKVTKPDKTVHAIPLANKAHLLSFNNRQPADQKWKIEEITEAEAKHLPFIDEDYVTGAEAVKKNTELLEKVQSQEDIITELRNQLAKKGNSGTVTPDEQKSATEVIDLIDAAKTIAEVDSLVTGDQRKTVIAAADKKRASLK